MVGRLFLQVVTLLAGLGSLAKAADAATLDQMRLFVGDQHARVMLVLDAPAAEIQTRSTPRIGSIAARGTVTLGDMSAGETFLEGFLSRDGVREFPVGQGGLRRILLAPGENDLSITVELDAPRDLKVTRVGEHVLLVDLLVPGVDEDRSLPTAEVLEAWVEGVSLGDARRAAPGCRPLIVVDAGHGGIDPGAIGVTGTRESEVTLALALRVARQLSQRLDVDVELTRDSNRTVSLQERASFANARDADLFVSIHANASPFARVSGIETYHLDAARDASAKRLAARENTSGGVSSDPTSHQIEHQLLVSGTRSLSKRLADEVQANTIARLVEVYGADQVNDLGTKTARFYVLASTRMPAILFESSFLSNPGDEMRLRSPAFQSVVATAMVEAIGRYLEEMGS